MAKDKKKAGKEADKFGAPEETMAKGKKRKQEAEQNEPLDAAKKGKKKKKKTEKVQVGNADAQLEEKPEQPLAAKKRKKGKNTDEERSEKRTAAVQDEEPEGNEDEVLKEVDEEATAAENEIRKKREEMLSYISEEKFDELFKDFLPPGRFPKKDAEEAAEFIRATYVHSLLERLFKLHKDMLGCFKGLTAKEARDRLSDPDFHTDLVLPSLHCSPYGPLRRYTYVGRRRFSELLTLIGPERTTMSGYPGRGKSYLLAAMACYLHAYEKEHEPVVYIQTSELVGRFGYLVGALLLAYVRHPEKQVKILSCAASETRLLEFCRKEAPLVLMDEVNALDVTKETAPSTTQERGAAARWRRLVFQRGVSCASYSSTFLPARKFHDMRVEDVFNETELACWASINGIPPEDYGELVFHTALVPRLLQQYRKRKQLYITQKFNDLHDYLDSVVTAKQELRGRRILNGHEYSLNGLNTDIFVFRKFGSRNVVSVLPFLEEEMRGTLDEKRSDADRERDLDNFIRRKASFQRAMKGDSERGLQPVAALNGLLAEWIARECVLLHKSCLGWSCASAVVYQESSDGQIEELSSTPIDVLKAGVCFVPFSSQARHADLHVVQLSDDGKILQVHSIQMSVSAWRQKKRKNSHVKWNESVDKAWSLSGCTVTADFTYVLSHALHQDVTGTTNVSVKNFKDVHPILAFIDELRDPELELKQCSGKNKDQSNCRRHKYTDEADYRCKDHANK